MIPATSDFPRLVLTLNHRAQGPSPECGSKEFLVSPHSMCWEMATSKMQARKDSREEAGESHRFQILGFVSSLRVAEQTRSKNKT